MAQKIKITLLFILPILVCISCAPKKVAENDWNEMGLKGKVKVLKIEKYFTDLKFGTQVKREQDANLHPDLPEEYLIFNKEGNIIETFSQSSKYEVKGVKAYDTLGNLFQEDFLKIEDGKYTKTIIRHVNIYDIHNNLTEVTKYQGDSILEKTITSFNKDGDKLIRNTYYGNGNPKEKLEYQYNLYGYLTKHKIPWYKYIREYNKYGEQVRLVYSSGEKVTTEYDQYGNVINSTSTGENNYYYNTTFQFDYDSVHNFIKKTYYNRRDKRDKFGTGSVKIREISYFDDGKNINDQALTKGIKSNRQILIPAGWKVVAIPNVGSIAIPPDMEIRDDRSLMAKKSANFRESIAVNKNIEIEKPLLLIQPKGINNQTKNASENYARILINVTNGQKGDFPKNDSELQYSDLSELNSIRKEQIQFFVKKFGKEIVNWSVPRNIKINGLNLIELNYVRAIVSTNKISDPSFYSLRKSLSFQDAEKWGREISYQSIVKVSDYTLFNDNKMISIVISYIDDNLWDHYTNITNPELDYMINTLDIEI